MPFGPDVLVYKVAGKMFALATLDPFGARVNLKCEPGRALDLRDRFDDIVPGYHMNKRHWNTVLLNGQVPHALILDLIDHSYEQVFAALPKRTRDALSVAKATKPGATCPVSGTRPEGAIGRSQRSS